MRVRLKKLKQSNVVLSRRFAFPPDAKPSDRFTVTVRYLSPAIFAEKQEQMKVKVVGANGKNVAEPDADELRKALVNDILIHTVEKIDDVDDKGESLGGVPIRKLRGLIQMSPEVIAESGGLEAVLSGDATSSSPGIREEALDNITVLLEESPEFFNWLMKVCGDLSNFQDEDWEKQAKNSGSGHDTNTAQQ